MYDGAGTTHLVTNINPGLAGHPPVELTVFDGDLYFRAYEGTYGEELWRYDPDTDI
jgi:hypothetical protein